MGDSLSLYSLTDAVGDGAGRNFGSGRPTLLDRTAGPLLARHSSSTRINAVTIMLLCTGGVALGRSRVGRLTPASKARPIPAGKAHERDAWDVG